MHRVNDPLLQRMKVGLMGLMAAALAGCLGYVDGGYGGAVIVPEPTVVFWGGGYSGGDYDRRHDVYEYSHRGAASRAVVHPVRPGGGHERTR